MFTLAYPYDTPTLSITLPSPEPGNSEDHNIVGLISRSRSGKLIAFRDGLWSKTQTHRYVFENLTGDAADDYQSFVQATHGKEIKMTDHRNLVWRGYILNPEGTITCYTDCMYSIDLSFSGVKA